MSNNSEFLILANGSSGSVIAAPEPTPQFLLNACCLWCDRYFTPRATGGSVQKFCCTGHRQQFWIAARRWTMRGDRGGSTLGRLLEGVPHERARCLRGHSAVRDTRMAEHIRAGGSRREISADLDDCQQDLDERGFGLSCPPWSSNSKHKVCYRSQRDTGDRDLARRGIDGQSLRRRGRGE